MKIRLPNEVMPVFSHPTTIVIVDDDKRYLESLSFSLSDYSLITFFEPLKAIEFINSQKGKFNHNIFKLAESSDKEKISLPNFSALMNSSLYNPNRFKTIFIIIVDFAMPIINGMEFCKKIEIDYIKEIMLTGEAQYSAAKEAFDKGLINQFVRKDDLNVEELVVKYIHNDQEKIFESFSFSIINQLDPESSLLYKLLYSSVIKFIKGFFKRQNVCEYCLWDIHGSYIMLDRDANPSWLLIRDEKDIQKSVEIAKHFKAPDSVIKSIENAEKILSVTNITEIAGANSINWDEYTFEAEIMPENSGIFYAFTDKLPNSSFKREKVISFNDFLYKG